MEYKKAAVQFPSESMLEYAAWRLHAPEQRADIPKGGNPGLLQRIVGTTLNFQTILPSYHIVFLFSNECHTAVKQLRSVTAEGPFIHQLFLHKKGKCESTIRANFAHCCYLEHCVPLHIESDVVQLSYTFWMSLKNERDLA
jgi:hypothetical protein